MTERKQLRAKLQCKDFKWFLDTVYPELHVPEDRPGFFGMVSKAARGGREFLAPRSDQQTLGKKGPFVGTTDLPNPNSPPLASTVLPSPRDGSGLRSRMSVLGATLKLASVNLPFCG